MADDLVSGRLLGTEAKKYTTWTGEESRIYENVLTSVLSTEQAKTIGYRQVSTERWTQISQELAIRGVQKNAEECRMKMLMLREAKPKDNSMFVFEQPRPSQDMPKSPDVRDSSDLRDEEESFDESFAHEKPSTHFSDENKSTEPTSRIFSAWTDEERGYLIQTVLTRRDLEASDNNVPVLSGTPLWRFVSTQLQQYSIERTPQSCQVYWRRHVADRLGFSSGPQSTKLNEAVTSSSLLSLSPQVLGAMLMPDKPTKTLSTTNTPTAGHTQNPPSSTQSNRGRVFTEEQRAALHKEAKNGLHPGKDIIDKLSHEHGLTYTQIRGWFGNARAAERTKKEVRTASEPERIYDISSILDEDSTDGSLVFDTACDNRMNVSSKREPRDTAQLSRKRQKLVPWGAVDSDDEPLILSKRQQNPTPHAEPAPETPADAYTSRPEHDSCPPAQDPAGDSAPTSKSTIPYTAQASAAARESDLLPAKIRDIDAQIQRLKDKVQSKTWEIMANNTEIDSLERQLKSLESQKTITLGKNNEKKADLEIYRSKIEGLGAQKKTLVDAIKILKGN